MEEQVKRDFPIDWDEDQYVSRREFFKFATLASGGLALGSVALAAWAQSQKGRQILEPMLIQGAESLAPGSAQGFNFPGPTDLCLLIRKPDGNYVAYSRRCTHLSCPVQYQPEKDRLYCPCHNGAFALDDGRVLQGPPPHPLPNIELRVEGGQVWAVGVKLEESES